MTQPSIPPPGRPGRWSRHTPEGQRRRRRALVTVVSVFGALSLLCCCGSGVALFSGSAWLDSLSDSPDEAAQRVVAAIRNRDAAAVYDGLCAPMKEKTTLEAVEQRIAEIPRFTSWEVDTNGTGRSRTAADGLRHAFVTFTLYDGRAAVSGLMVELGDVDDGVFTSEWKPCGTPLL